MRHVYMRAFVAALLTGMAAATTQAQVFTPTYTSPRLLNELGIYLSDGPGDVGFEGIWRGGPVGLRVGFVDVAGGALTVGGEIRSPLPIQGAPLGLALTAAAQGIVGDADAIGLAGGLSAGYTFRSPGMAITPYLHPRVGMVQSFGRNRDWDFEVLADIGADLEFHTNIVVKLGIKLDDVGSNFGVGLAWRR
jgi:hypothetical protein